MPSFNLYQKMYGGRTQGQVRKDDSDLVLERTWYEDINTRTVYVYNQERDSEFEAEGNLQPWKTNKIPIDVKFFEMEYNSLAKDEVPYHIMFKPSFDYHEVVPYYDKEINMKYEATFPAGLYFDIPDSKGIYNRWLCVGEYRHYGTQFPSYVVLPINHKLQWIHDRKKYESWCVLRSQNSYNNGLWTDFKITLPENQKIIWLSANEKTLTLSYNDRLIISQERDIPITWQISKVEDMNIKGVICLTGKQDQFDVHSDYIEKDKDGNVIGMWASYYDINDNPPEEPEQPITNIYSKVTYSGSAAEIKVRGSYKKFTVTFYDDNGEVPFRPGVWTYTIDDVDASLLLEIQDSEINPELTENQTRIKFIGTDEYIGKNLVVTYVDTTGIKSSQTMNIVGI